MFDEKRIRKHGTPARAVVVSMQRHSHVSSNDYQRYDYVLEVHPAGEGPFQVEVHDTFLIVMGKPEQFDEVNVKFDPKTKETVFDLEGDPRFDLEAMKAHTAQLRQETAQMNAAYRQQQGR